MSKLIPNQIKPLDKFLKDGIFYEYLSSGDMIHPDSGKTISAVFYRKLRTEKIICIKSIDFFNNFEYSKMNLTLFSN